MLRAVRFCLFPIFTGCFLWLSTCQSQNEEELFGIPDCDTTDVSWSEDIEPILQGKCYHCHYDNSPITPFSLQGYRNVLVRVNSGQLNRAVNHLPGYPQMPKDGPKLPACELDRINQWIKDGAPNN